MAPATTTADGGPQEPIFTPAFWTLMASNAFLRLSTFMLVTLVPVFAVAEGMGTTVAGLTTTAFMVAALAFRPSAGRLTDQHGRYAVLMVGAVTMTLASLTFVFTLPAWALLAVRFVHGFGFSFSSTAAGTVATDIIPERRLSEGIGYLGLEQTLTMVVGPAAALAIMDAAGFSWAFGVASAFALLHVLLRLPLRRRLKATDAAARRRRADRARAAVMAAHPAHGGEGADAVERTDAGHGATRGAGSEAGPGAGAGTVEHRWWHRIVDRDAWKPSSLMLLLMVPGAACSTFLAIHVLEKGLGNAGLFFATSGVAVGAARLVVGRLERRFGNGWTIGVGTVLVIAAMLCVAWTPNVLVLGVAGAVYGAGWGTVQPSVSAMAVLSAPKERRGAANSTFFMALDTAQAASSALLGLAATAWGVGSVFGIAAGVGAAALALFLTMKARGVLA